MAHAPGSSASNWEAEQGWSPISKRLIGKELGRSAAPTKEALFGKFENQEDAIRSVTDQALKEFHALLQGIRTKGRNYQVLGL